MRYFLSTERYVALDRVIGNCVIPHGHIVYGGSRVSCAELTLADEAAGNNDLTL
jgi:hypothetical protein